MLALAPLLLLAASPLEDYERARQSLEASRVTLASRWKRRRDEARDEARRTLIAYLDDSAFPAWAGTPWEFYGTSTTPREGTIACGYFVTTVLEQAGFKIERVFLAQQASAALVNTLAHGSRVEWLRPADNADALRRIRERFPKAELLVIGFDFHVGLLRLDGEEARFCHSSWLEPAAVTCEEPVASGAFASRLYVVADVLNDALLDDWLNARAVRSLKAR
jgi:hypothetical protein